MNTHGKINNFFINKYNLSNSKNNSYRINNYKIKGKYGGIDSYTKFLPHMNGANGSTSFIDSSLSPHTVTVYGNAQISTAQSKFGGASGSFDGAGDYIDTPDSTDFTLGSGNFTVDCWIKRNVINVRHAITGQMDNLGGSSSTSFYLEIRSSNIVRFVVCSGSTSYIADSVRTITDTNWHHIAAVRNGNTITVYIDGTASGTADVTGVSVNDSTNKLAIGRFGEYDADYFNGYIDEYRFSKGIARWTSNFTPPIFEYTT